MPRTNYFVLARDAEDVVTSYGLAEVAREHEHYYTLLEKRTLDDSGSLTIEHGLFRSRSQGDIGEPVALNAIERYAHLKPTITFAGMNGTGLIPLRMPMENCVDGSPDPVSVYAAAVSEIQQAYKFERLYWWEFENAQSRVFGPEDIIRRTKDGQQDIVDNIFIEVDEDPAKVSLTVYNPTIRQAEFEKRKNDYLRTIENIIGIKRGLLSEVEAEERTATEITSSAGEYNLTVIDIQEAWSETAREVLNTCRHLGRIYYGWSIPESVEPTFDYGDGVLYNRDKTFEELRSMVVAGQLKGEILLDWYFEQKAKTPEEFAAVREKYMPDIAEEDGL